MSRGHDSFDVGIDLSLGRETDPRERSLPGDGAPFRLAVVGDFSAGRSVVGAHGGMASWRVDRDDLEALLATISPTLSLDLGDGTRVEIRIRSFDDFHPDTLVQRVPGFARLTTLRRRLADPSTFRDAVREWTGEALAPAAAPAPGIAPSAPVAPLLPTAGGLLDAIVGASDPSSPASAPAPTDALQAFVRRAMIPSLVERADPRQDHFLAMADAAIASALRAVLHHPAFQALESLWRGMDRLVREVETDEQLHIHAVDCWGEALRDDLVAHDVPTASRLYRTLATIAPAEDGGLGACVLHFGFGAGSDAVRVLERIAAVGAALDAPMFAEATPELASGSLGLEVSDAWERLRGGVTGRYLSLALPRVLVRLPYGKDGEPCERLAFEELQELPADGTTRGVHEQFLWGNPALATAILVADGVRERGHGFAAGRGGVLTGLPLHLTKRGGVTVVTPCAELVMQESDALALIDAGFVPMLGIRDTDEVRVGRVQSVSQGVPRLAGRWGG